MAMRVERKKRARRSTEQEVEKPDRLSDLPDTIIHQILSFLELKDAIQTCVLSKRWKHLWVSLPDLNFGCQGFTHLSFTNFVSKVLSSRADCSIGKFQLSCWFCLDHSLVKRIINYVVSHYVRHLDLSMDTGPYSYSLFHPLLTLNSLKTLYISNVLFEELPESFGFGFTMLSSLNLSRCQFCYEGGSADPFVDCPNLKSLCLLNCNFSSLQVLKISGPQLLNFKIEDGYISDCKVEIFAPKLLSFYFEHSIGFYFSGTDIPSLSFADIYLHSNYSILEHGMLVEKEKYTLDLINLFQGLCNAEVISLSSATIEFLNWVPSLEKQQPAPLKRLKSLKVECNGNSLKMPDNVKNYLLGDNPYEETMCMEDTPHEKTRYAVFHKVQA